MSSVDGFLVALPEKNLAACRRLARRAGTLWMAHGALADVECIADDVQPGKLTSFPQAVKLKPGAIVAFSWIVSASRAQRDRINRAVMAEPFMAKMDKAAMPFDGARMVRGGFKAIVQL